MRYSKSDIIEILKDMKNCINSNSDKFFKLHSLLYNIMYGDTNGENNYCDLDDEQANLLLDLVYDFDYVDQDIFYLLNKGVNIIFYDSEKRKMLDMIDNVLKSL